MTLEQQLVELAAIGLALEPGVTVDDLVVSRDRAVYERIPFRHLLRDLGAEAEAAPKGRRICRRAWAFDTECIVDPGDYVAIVNRLAAMAGAGDRVRDVAVETGAEPTLRYALDGEPRRLSIELVDDWADLRALRTVMLDLASSAGQFYGQVDGQVVHLYFLSAAGAARVNALADGHMVLAPVADWVSDRRPAQPGRPVRPARPVGPVRAARPRSTPAAAPSDPDALASAITSYVSGAGSRAVEAYDIARRFAVNDHVSHPVFGVGVVVRSDHTQIGVLFGDGLRMLAHGRSTRR